MPLKSKELIWLTGFWEGDGSCGFYDKKGYNVSRRTGLKKTYWYKTFRMTISQKQPYICYWLRKKVGFGTIVKQGGRQRYGDKVTDWRGDNAAAYVLLKSMVKYMVTKHKKAQAMEAIKGYEHWKTSKV